MFILGLGLVGMSDEEWKFSQTWVWLAIVLFVIALGISHGVMVPAVKRMGALMREMVAAGPPHRRVRRRRRPRWNRWASGSARRAWCSNSS